MWGRLGGFCRLLIILLIILPYVVAIDATPPSAQPPAAQQDQNQVANRFLSAELTRQMQAQKEEMLKALQQNQDDNFRALDGRMTELVAAERMKVIIGGVGAILVANAIVALVMLRYMRRYSYEKYLEDTLGRRDGEIASLKSQQDEIAKLLTPQAQEPPKNPYAGAFQEYQQPVWTPQQAPEHLGVVLGQERVGNMSQMNAWQLSPNYEGAWTPPVPVKRELEPWRPRQEGEQNG